MKHMLFSLVGGIALVLAQSASALSGHGNTLYVDYLVPVDEINWADIWSGNYNVSEHTIHHNGDQVTVTLYSGLPYYAVDGRFFNMWTDDLTVGGKTFTFEEAVPIMGDSITGTAIDRAQVDFERRDGIWDRSGNTDYARFGQWMDHVGFFVTEAEHWDDDLSFTQAMVLSDGMSGSLPTFNRETESVRWFGDLIGIDMNDGHEVKGTASMSVNFSWLPEWSILLDFMRKADGSWYNDNNGWYARFGYRESPMVVTDDGTFSNTLGSEWGDQQGSSLSGAFYGPNHEELAGTFHWKNSTLNEEIIGSFGGTKAIWPKE